jgi:hypothetical protein
MGWLNPDLAPGAVLPLPHRRGPFENEGVAILFLDRAAEHRKQINWITARATNEFCDTFRP